MTTTPILSVVMPTHNRAEYAGPAIEAMTADCCATWMSTQTLKQIGGYIIQK